MNTFNSQRQGETRKELLAEVDFKWLMAGQGCWVDTRRLRNDPAYANSCLLQALGSSCDALRGCASLLQAELALVGVSCASTLTA